MSDLYRLRELAALFKPFPVQEARVKTRGDLEKKFKDLEEGVQAAMKDLLFEIGSGGALETMMQDVGISKHKDAVPMLKELQTLVSSFQKGINTSLMEAEGLLFSAMTESHDPDPVNEMASINKFRSGWMKSAEAREMVKAFRAGEETVELSNGSSFKAIKTVNARTIEKGMLVMGSYNGSNQGAELYEILGVSSGKDKDKVAYDSVKEAMTDNKVSTLEALDAAINCHLVVKDIDDGDTGGFFYVYRGAWARDSGAERVSFTLVEQIKTVKEAKNHMDEHEYQSYRSWKAALEKKFGKDKLKYDGDIDIAQALVDGKGVGEWDGAVGCIYN
jgi:hypothetical protein